VDGETLWFGGREVRATLTSETSADALNRLLVEMGAGRPTWILRVEASSARPESRLETQDCDEFMRRVRRGF
jgi:hypothetical protein